MRSRFSAYATKNYQFILNTYSKEKQKALTVSSLRDSAEGATWFALHVNSNSPKQDKAIKEVLTKDTVEFTAFYFENKSMFQLHETSDFIKENNEWRYHDGTLHSDCGKVKYGRNLPCVCGSQKKFKQCCATKAR